jgi:hypothetical protein
MYTEVASLKQVLPYPDWEPRKPEEKASLGRPGHSSGYIIKINFKVVLYENVD